MKTTIQDKNGLKTVNLNRRRAIREKCLNCSCWSTAGVERCTFPTCPLYPFRKGTGKQNPEERIEAIKAYCFWCMNSQIYEIAKCPSLHCPLFSFRRATRPKSNPLPKNHSGGGTPEDKVSNWCQWPNQRFLNLPPLYMRFPGNVISLPVNSLITKPTPQMPRR